MFENLDLGLDLKDQKVFPVGHQTRDRRAVVPVVELHFVILLDVQKIDLPIHHVIDQDVDGNQTAHAMVQAVDL